MIAVGIGAAVGLALIAYSWWCTSSIRSAERGTADARVSKTEADGKLAAMTSDRDAHKARADYQEKRANALDVELQTESDDPDTARERVLARLKAAESGGAAHGGGAGTVPASGSDPSVARDDDTALERPSE